MQIRMLLLALVAFTVVNGAITFYLVRTMYSADQHQSIESVNNRFTAHQ